MNIIIDFFAQTGEILKQVFSDFGSVISGAFSDLATLTGFLPVLYRFFETFTSYCPTLLVSLVGVVVGIRVIQEVRK